jgi:hypothetical protein
VSGTGPWWLCPNEPRCPHGRIIHDVYYEDDEVPRCCAGGCQCGARPGPGPMTREEYRAILAARDAG